ncbi:hypothetical protein HBN50_14425 [Halobacteriovorax sp. GB3]|uniref:hypothetical protein n=1 Tax=Halobacteriovorax sp. GB3 TaxID=2719615 RepID=UPI002362622C|nr:hypothetical protein [Halobacteriovorax sp. GB3]MDD0854305.1 hypothetical protein [Halobacteriovorax sp. GB3]
MKALKLIFVMAFLISFIQQGLAVGVRSVPVDNLFAPMGFNSNDNVEVVVSGFLPNLCYKDLRINPIVEGNRIKIDVKANDLSAPDVVCGEMIVPFLEEVQLGVLDQGWYDVEVNGEINNEIYIEEAIDDAIEDEVLANVEVVVKDEYSRIIKLKGHNPSSCYEFEAFEVIDNGKDVYSVSPIMKKVSEFCPMKMVPFELEFEVPNDLKSDRLLIHVKSMYGNNLNSLFNNSAF